MTAAPDSTRIMGARGYVLLYPFSNYSAHQLKEADDNNFTALWMRNQSPEDGNKPPRVTQRVSDTAGACASRSKPGSHDRQPTAVIGVVLGTVVH